MNARGLIVTDVRHLNQL